MEQHNQLLINKINAYRPSDEAIEIVQATPLLTLSGIAGAGKDTVGNRLLQTGKYHRIISHTTRVPRTNNGVQEVNGVDYHFVDPVTAEHMIDKRGFVEVKGVHTKIYGTSVGEFVLARDEGKIAIAEIDVQGADEYVRLNPRTRAVFLIPPDPNTWLLRLKNRYQDDWRAHRDDILIRFASAQRELGHVANSPHYHLVINRTMEETVQIVRSIAEEGSDFSQNKVARASIADILGFLASSQSVEALE
ncbi:hypothetical protein CYG49_04860 [Candidatus Saccharibacteria bacterium]|nr:MAG: hypothetical protein CYG49_04860 [Candidatus Saccharibacteria bacterium]